MTKLKLSDQEKEMISIAYDSWFFAVATHQNNELVAHHAKRFKYLIDWIGTTLEIETERKTNDTSNTNDDEQKSIDLIA